MKESILQEKSYKFAIRIVGLSKHLSDNKEFVLSKQVLRSGTAIGALISEAEFGQSRLDFRSKMAIALKEANETRYWLRLLRDTNYIDERAFASMLHGCEELIKMLVSTVKTTSRSRDNEE